MNVRIGIDRFNYQTYPVLPSGGADRREYMIDSIVPGWTWHVRVCGEGKLWLTPGSFETMERPELHGLRLPLAGA